MKLAFITPISEIELSTCGDILFVLPQISMKSKRYTNFYKKQKKYKICDNGLAENAQVTNEQMMRAAKAVKADEIIAPDTLYDRSDTVRKTKEFIRWLKLKKLLKQFKIMAVPQGKNKEEWIECYKELIKIPEVKVIGFSKLSIVKCFSNFEGKDKDEISSSRQRCIKYLLKNKLIDFKKEYHLLGRGCPTELKNKNYFFIRSSDSCIECLSAMIGFKFDWNKGVDGKRPNNFDNYFDRKISKKNSWIVLNNILVTRRFANENK